MKEVLMINGSSRAQGKTALFLELLQRQFTFLTLAKSIDLDQLPLFRAEDDHHPWPDHVIRWRNTVAKADAILITTPEYLKNVPAVLKNALEWLTTSGEVLEKKTLPITLTPHPPRGEKAMKSLLFSLDALGAHVVAQIDLYQQDIAFDANEPFDNDTKELLATALGLL